MKSIAYHLRQDGKYFPITAHIYCSGDGTLSGESEAAEFILVTKSKGSELAKQVLDTWIGLKVISRYSVVPDNIPVDRFILPAIHSTQELMEYHLTDTEVLAVHNECNNYTTMGELRDYLELVDITTLQNDIMTLLNQQFCRVRYGGIYNSHGEPEVWIRISSVGVSWTDVIYKFVTAFKNVQKVDYITICRDRTSPDETPGYIVDGADNIKIYRANDGELYLHMPINEYLSEVHDTGDIFTTTLGICRPHGRIYQYIWERLCNGEMLHDIIDNLYSKGIDLDISAVWDILTKIELQQCE